MRRRSERAADWESRPQLRDPVLVAAFTGWNDAGDAASDAVAWLAAQYAARPFASIDPDEHYDFQANRPEVELVDGVTREISWPTLEFSAAPVSGAGPRPRAALRAGAEPAVARVLRHRARGRARDRLPHRRDVRRAARRHAAHRADPRHREHHRPADDGAARARAVALRGPDRHRRRAPRHCRNAGLTSASFWAPVPHYVATPPNPPATRALLERFADVHRRPLDLRELGVAARGLAGPGRRRGRERRRDARLRARARGAARRRRRCERRRPTRSEEIPSGDDLAEAFEEYLREQGLE